MTTMEELAFYEHFAPLFTKHRKREPTEKELAEAWENERERHHKLLEALKKVQSMGNLSHEDKARLLNLLVGPNPGLTPPSEFLSALDEDLVRAYLLPAHPDAVLKKRQSEFDRKQATETKPYYAPARTNPDAPRVLLGPDEREQQKKEKEQHRPHEHDPEHDYELDEQHGEIDSPPTRTEEEEDLGEGNEVEQERVKERHDKPSSEADKVSGALKEGEGTDNGRGEQKDDGDDNDEDGDAIDLGDEQDELRRIMRERGQEVERKEFERQHEEQRLSNLRSEPSTPAPSKEDTGLGFTLVDLPPTQLGLHAPLDRIAYSRLEPPAFWETSDIGYKELEVSPKSEEHRWLQGLFTQTIADYHRRRNRFKFNSYVVTKIIRVQNPALWMRYTSRRTEILAECNGQAPKIEKLLTHPSTNPAVNEYFLFHGLDVKKIGRITRFGFDVRFSSLDGMFGAAIYLSENSSKSDQYMHSERCHAMGANAENCQCAPEDELMQLVCRVTLGDAFLETKYQGNEPGQFWHHRRVEPTKPDGTPYHSVVAESRRNCKEAKLRLREYVVYDTCQVYPEYIVHYHRA